MLTFLSPCHRCSVLRQLGCKDGKNWNSKYVISWYMWHKINNTFLSLPTSRCIRIHCFSWGRGGGEGFGRAGELFAFSSLEFHIFVSKLLIDLYLHKPQQWDICRFQRERKLVTSWSVFLPGDVMFVTGSPWGMELISISDMWGRCGPPPASTYAAGNSNGPFQVYCATRKSSPTYLPDHYHLIYVYWFLMCTFSRLSVNFISLVLTATLQI